MPGLQVAEDFAALPAAQWLCSQGPWRVAIASAPQLPRALPEIGRLRELTFRAAGEGTGRARDLDAFDARYLHLCVWHAEAREIVGAYRLGPTDVLARGHDTGAMYTSTLFRYDGRLLERIGPAIELGRSFVRAEYQRDYAPLLLLWKGIGRFVAQHPRYRHLFGPVSISGEYAPASRELLRAFLETSCASPLAPLVAPRQPARDAAGAARRPGPPLIADLDGVDALIVNLEGEGRGVPVLLRQYLRLGARALGFAVDPAFAHTLDALMLVDLTAVPPAVLARYMGRAPAEAFLGRHAPGPARSPAVLQADARSPGC
jgi:putative hemolysin